MSLPRTDDVAAMRALDRECAVSDSVVSLRTVGQLSVAPPSSKTSFLYCSTYWGLAHQVRCALEAGASPDTTTGEESGSLPVLVAAVCQGAAPALKALLAGGANIELADKFGKTALGYAAQEGQLSCLQLLLDAGANANARDWLGHTPLMSTVMRKHVDCARALLPASDLAITDRMGNTALHAAVLNASEACFELLLPAYDVNVRTVPGFKPSGEAVLDFNTTALHIACDKGLLPMCKALLSRGADRMARDNEQWTPLHWAARRGHLSCVVMLVGRPGKVRMTPAEVGAADDKGSTALHCAALNGFDQVCGVLLAAGARLDAQTSSPPGLNPLKIAQYHHPTNAALLALLSGNAPAQPPGLVCDRCGETADQGSVKGLKSCGRCYAARYCSKECQAAAWPGHKAACKARVEEREKESRVNC